MLPAVVITRRCASVLLAAVAMMLVALIPAARSQPFKPPIRLSAAPPTNVASLRAQSAVLTATLRTDNVSKVLRMTSTPTLGMRR